MQDSEFTIKGKTIMLKQISSLFIFALLSFNVSAVEVAGVQFTDRIENTNLKLNGAGIRYKIFFKIYAAALYVESPSQDANIVITQNGDKRLVMHIVYDEINKEKMIDSMIDGFEDNLTSDEFKNLKSRIDQLLAQYQGVKENDVLMFDYTIKKGTTFSINGTDKVTIAGAEFNQALLKIWLGDEPATSSLKDALLGLKEESNY